MYTPPFTITDEIMTLVADIAERVGHLSASVDQLPAPHLRKENRIKTILFWVSDRSKDYVATKPIHESQKHYRGDKEAEMRRQYPTLEGGAFFSIECVENYELIRELTSFGADLVVLSPEEVRRSVIQNCDKGRLGRPSS